MTRCKIILSLLIPIRRFNDVEHQSQCLWTRVVFKTWSFLLLGQRGRERRILDRRKTGNTALTFTIVLGHVPPPSESHYSSALHNGTSTASSCPPPSSQLPLHLCLLWSHTHRHTPLSPASFFFLIPIIVTPLLVLFCFSMGQTRTTLCCCPRQWRSVDGNRWRAGVFFSF